MKDISFDFQIREPVPKLERTLWTNPDMRFCNKLIPQGCGFADTDEDTMVSHIAKHHMKLAQLSGAEPEDAKTQLSIIDGRVLTIEDRKIAMLQALPNDRVTCPFCFEQQEDRATRIFASDGSANFMKSRKCVECGQKMHAETMRMLRQPPREFGRWVGAYPRFWKFVDHDSWLRKLKVQYPKDELRGLFWEGYGDSRPEFKEKQRQRQAERDYEKSTGFKD